MKDRLSDMFEGGIVKDNHWLAYGFKHGFGYKWMPGFVQRFIVMIWNHVACFFFGHDESLRGIEDVCTHCCKRLPKI